MSHINPIRVHRHLEEDALETGPTIDSIEVAEFESQAALKEWVRQKAPAFVL